MRNGTLTEPNLEQRGCEEWALTWISKKKKMSWIVFLLKRNVGYPFTNASSMDGYYTRLVIADSMHLKIMRTQLVIRNSATLNTIVFL